MFHLHHYVWLLRHHGEPVQSDQDYEVSEGLKMEETYWLVMFAETDGECQVLCLTKSQIAEKTKDLTPFDYAVFQGNCLKDFNGGKWP